jgi:hypothetical protein
MIAVFIKLVFFRVTERRPRADVLRALERVGIRGDALGSDDRRLQESCAVGSVSSVKGYNSELVIHAQQSKTKLSKK